MLKKWFKKNILFYVSKLGYCDWNGIIVLGLKVSYLGIWIKIIMFLV